MIAIRPSPVVDQFKKNGPFLYIGLDDQSFDTLKNRVGVKKASEIYLSFLRTFALTVYNLDLENCDELKRLLESLKNPEAGFVENSVSKISRIKKLISLETGSEFPKNTSEQLIEVINSIYKSWISPTQKILRDVSGRKTDELIPVILQEMHSGLEEKPVEYFKVKNYDDKTGTLGFQCFRSDKRIERPSFDLVSEKEVGKALKVNKLQNLIKSLTKKVQSPLEVYFLIEEDTLLLISLKEVALSQKKFIEFVVSSVQEKIIEKRRWPFTHKSRISRYFSSSIGLRRHKT